MVTQSALDVQLNMKPGPLPCSAGIAGQAGGNGCLWVADSDVRLSAMIAWEEAVGERHPRRSGETKQLRLLYLD